MASATRSRSSCVSSESRLWASVVRLRTPIVRWYVRPSSRKRSREISIPQVYPQRRPPLRVEADGVLLRRKSEQHVAAGAEAQVGVTGIHEHHAAGDDRAGAVEGTTLRLHPVDGGVGLIGVVGPQHAAVLGVVGAH